MPVDDASAGDSAKMASSLGSRLCSVDSPKRTTAAHGPRVCVEEKAAGERLRGFMRAALGE